MGNVNGVGFGLRVVRSGGFGNGVGVCFVENVRGVQGAESTRLHQGSGSAGFFGEHSGAPHSGCRKVHLHTGEASS